MILMPRNFDMLYRCHCVFKTWCETTKDPNNNKKIHATGCNSSSSSRSCCCGGGGGGGGSSSSSRSGDSSNSSSSSCSNSRSSSTSFFACPLFHSYIPTSVPLFIYHLSVYIEWPNMCPLRNQKTACYKIYLSANLTYLSHSTMPEIRHSQTDLLHGKRILHCLPE